MAATIFQASSISSPCAGARLKNLGLFQSLLHQIELESPAQVGPPSRSTFNEDEGSRIAISWGILGLDATSTLGVPWRDVSAALVDHLASVAYVSTPDLRDSYKISYAYVLLS